jgi:hypothetical protein
MNTNLAPIEKALHENRYETARRLALRELAGKPPEADAVRRLLHQACLEEGEFAAAHKILDEIVPANDEERLEITLLHAIDYRRCAGSNYWRDSEEARAGMTDYEINDKMRDLGEKAFVQAVGLAKTEQQRLRVAEAMISVGLKDRALQLGLPLPEQKAAAPRKPVTEFGTVSGTVKFPDGRPAAQVKLTLGLKVEWRYPDAARERWSCMGYRPHVGPQEVLTTETDANGAFRFDKVPAEKQEFLAASLDPEKVDIATRFLAQRFDVAPNRDTRFDLTLTDWKSAPAREVKSPFVEEIKVDGVTGRRVFEQFFKNPFYFHFPRQIVHFTLPPGVTTNPERLVLLSAPNAKPESIQVTGREVYFFAEVPEKTDRVFALYALEKAAAPAPLPNLTLDPQQDGTAIVDTGRAKFRIPNGLGADPLPPLLAVQGADKVWRGQGRFRLPDGISIVSRKTEATEIGPLVLQWTTSYQLSNGTAYEIRFTAHRDEAYLLAHEISPAIEGASFDFSLREFGKGGRGYLHWTPERNSSRNWSTLRAEKVELARLQESVAWWVPPMGFAYAFTPDSLEQRDYIGVFTIRRGDWIDRKFESLIQRPINADGTENRELDWPYCEMVGSTISMITAETDASGDAFFKFGFFNGERHWGILASDFGINDGPFKELSAVEHKNSSPRLQEFKDWRLDEPDHIERPFLVVPRKNLKTIRQRIKSPFFKKIWDKVLSAKANQSAAQGIAFAVEGDPVIAWRKKLDIFGVAAIQSKMTLLGRDFDDSYSPVGGRFITPRAEEYDLIAASGVFTPEEEREVRTFLLLMGHLYMSPDLMNWKHNSRNANFEADRADIVAACGFAFHGNPDGDRMIAHAAELMEKSVNTYCTPGSGRWYENPAGYYIHASKCRLNLAFHLANHDVQDPTLIPRMKEFLRWGILLLTPPFPTEYAAMRDGTSDPDYRKAAKARRIAPIGDHAVLGSGVLAEHYATMAKLYRARDPEFADLLLWAYQQGGNPDGGDAYLASLVVNLKEEELSPAPAQQLPSRRLEGFGSVFRSHFGEPNEFYLLLKQGPGGYRYHRTEGSIILFADGKPLIYEGGGAGETWRHTTLSFYDAHMPLACGHVERFSSFAGLDFSQGVHPVAVKPGEYIQANDPCHHDLVPVAWQRFNEPNPADVRSVLWIKDEYVILHDDLRLDPSVPAYWHLQAVADSETGNPQDGYLFKGRHGTDLQVTLPDQTFVEQSVEVTIPLEYHVPKEKSFTMRHVQLRADQPDHYLAVIRPLPKGKGVLRSRTIRLDGRVRGVHVEGDGIRDDIFLARAPFAFEQNGVRFQGRYGTVIHRPGQLQLSLLAGSLLEADGTRIESTGPSVYLAIRDGVTELAAEGSGTVTVIRAGKTDTFAVNGKVAARLTS